MSENKQSSLHKHLMGGDISALETALKLEATVGFPYSDYKYYIIAMSGILKKLTTNSFTMLKKTAPSVVMSMIELVKQAITLQLFYITAGTSLK